MSSFLCFICHSTVNEDTNEETRERYREVVGMNLCPDSHLCHICCHVLNKLWLFKTVCLKRSLEYPVLFSEKGTLNLQRNDLELHTICPEDSCGQYHNCNINSKSYHILFNDYSYHYEPHQAYNIDNQYVELEDERTDFDVYFNINEVVAKETINYDCKSVQTSECIQYESKEVQTDTQNEFNCEIVKDGNSSGFNHDIEEDLKDHEENYNEIGDLEEPVDTEFNEDLTTNDIKAEENIEEFKKSTEREITLERDTEKEELSENLELTEESSVKKKHKSKKKKKKEFEKIILTLEQQKADLEGKRKEKKYMSAEFKCYNCALGFLFKDTYQTHMMRHEESNGEYRCQTCTLRFATPAVLRAHTAIHAERYLCRRCGLTIRIHGRRVHARDCWERTGDVVACHLCGGTFQDSNGLQQHLKRFHRSKTSGRSYCCSVCGKSYGDQAAVRTHMIKHINRRFNCDKCPSTFSSPYMLNKHKKKHDVTEIKLHYCTICNIGYGSRKNLLAHRRNALNHQQTIFECPICTRVSPNERALASHIQSVHSSTKNFACPTCPARYSNRKSLVRHIGSHGAKTEPKVAICHLCGASFKGNNKLNRHLKQVCEKFKLEEEFSNLYEQECMNTG